jgi:hypothetical protein
MRVPGGERGTAKQEDVESASVFGLGILEAYAFDQGTNPLTTIDNHLKTLINILIDENVVSVLSTSKEAGDRPLINLSTSFSNRADFD